MHINKESDEYTAFECLEIKAWHFATKTRDKNHKKRIKNG